MYTIDLFIFYQWEKGKLAEKQGRKATGLKENVSKAAGLPKWLE
jgi:hypothetical protein